MTDTEPARAEPDLEERTRAYLEAFEARDLDRCIAFYAADPHIDFQLGVFEGRDAIVEWHQDRFAANLQVLRVESIRVKNDTVVVDALVSSDRLAAWKIKTMSGRVKLRFEGAQIVKAGFAPRVLSPVDMIRSS